MNIGMLILEHHRPQDRLYLRLGGEKQSNIVGSKEEALIRPSSTLLMKLMNQPAADHEARPQVAIRASWRLHAVGPMVPLSAVAIYEGS